MKIVLGFIVAFAVTFAAGMAASGMRPVVGAAKACSA